MAPDLLQVPSKQPSGIAGVQRVIADLAVRLVTIEPRLVDESIGHGLCEIAKVLRLDRAFLWRNGFG